MMWEFLAKKAFSKIDKYVVINFLISVAFDVFKRVFREFVAAVTDMVERAEASGKSGIDKFNMVKTEAISIAPDMPMLLLQTIIQVVVAKFKGSKIEDFIASSV
ncbi:MAG: hypothetical protein AB1454_04180 [Candidatus Auribacterota bacterium]